MQKKKKKKKNRFPLSTNEGHVEPVFGLAMMLGLHREANELRFYERNYKANEN